MSEFKVLTDDELDKVTGGVNWPRYGACLLQHGAGAIPALAEVVAAIKAKDWGKVAKLSGKAQIAALPIVASCLASC